MNILKLILNDPLVLYSLFGLLLVLGICSYYVYYFLTNISHDNQQ